ncbi:MAG: hypothetical protein FWC78_04340 [Defluviitaleaceae bacterium]|nr:hypothetical protein [Defluviitaleaceae bacterium]
MSEHHDKNIKLQPIEAVAQFYKSLIPANIPGEYELNPKLNRFTSEENIRAGVIAFRDFLNLFCSRLISHGNEYALPPKTPKNIDDYPFLSHVTNLLVDIGYHGQLSENGDSMLLTAIPSFTAKPKTPANGQMQCLRFLAICGFSFPDIDLNAKSFKGTEIEIFYPSNPLVLAGLKAMAIADIELRTTKRYANDKSLLRCEYRLLKAKEPDILDILKDAIQSLPAETQSFIIKLHQKHIDKGLTCAITILGDIHFAYAYVKSSKKELTPRDIYSRRTWGISISLKRGFCLVVKAKKTDNPASNIEYFHPSLRQIIEKGYGCDRLFNERCNWGCQGIRIPLDENILNFRDDIETWLDSQLPKSISVRLH